MSSLLDLLQEVGRAKSGTRGIVVEAFDAIDTLNGAMVHLPSGTRFEIQFASGASFSAVVELNGALRRVAILVESYHLLALKK